jgi:large subunit ribosomal protein L4
MPKVKVVDTTGKRVSEIKLADEVFGIEPNKSAMHLAVVSYLANQRQGTQSTLTRSEVKGGGKKPWRQKGTGRARQGSIRAPQWTHGGIALGPKPRTYGISINKKVKKLAMKSALSSKVLDGELVVVKEFGLSEISTSAMAKVVSAVAKDQKKALIVLPENDEVIYKSARNIEGVKVVTVNSLCVYYILNAGAMIALKDTVKKIEEVYA